MGHRIRPKRRRLPAFVLVLVSTYACTGAQADLPRNPGERASTQLVRRGRLVERIFLTGTVEAINAVTITAPRVPGGQLQIRWMEEDGAFVRKGQKVLEFANAAFASDLEDKKLSASKARKELLKLASQTNAETAEKAFAVEQQKTEMEKARLEANVPKELLPLREYQERQLKLQRAGAAYEKAREDHATHVSTKQQELAIQELSLQKTLYEIRVAEDAIEALILEAPRDGVILIGDIPWEGRKLQEGDNIWRGFVIMRLPDLSNMRVVARLSDVDDGSVRSGMKATVELDAHPEVSYDAVVEDVTPVAQESSRRSLRRSFRVRVALAGADEDRLLPGMAARVEVISNIRDDVLLVPRSALDLSTSPPRARLADKSEVELTLGPCNPLDCIVEAGIAEGTALSLGSAP